jgi:hypothetical protein
MEFQPTLLNSCALAATADEARFRIDAEVDLRRVTRIVALDEAAASVVRDTSEGEWTRAHFLVVDSSISEPNGGDHGADLVLHDAKGVETHLSAELEQADSVVLVATSASAPGAVRTIGAACTLRGIMVSGVVFGDDEDMRDAVSLLRPYARVLLVSRDNEDVADLLTALRA